MKKTLLATLSVLIGAACGGDSASRQATSSARATLGGRGSAQTPTASAIRVDPRIAAACELPSARFMFDSSDVRSTADGALGAVARCFATGPLRDKGMKLVGHADPRGETEYNFALGQRRAGAVAAFIAGRGVSASRIATSSKGELEASGTDDAGWAADRRVDIMLRE
jgi:peptidoglycan-associated lipoprotein